MQRCVAYKQKRGQTREAERLARPCMIADTPAWITVKQFPEKQALEAGCRQLEGLWE